MKKLIRPLVRGLHAYVPGEQPKIKGLIKLNTNENPYPPSPKSAGGGQGGGGRAVAAVSESDGAGVARKAGEAARLQAGKHHRRQRLGRIAGAGGARLRGTDSSAEDAQVRRCEDCGTLAKATVQYFTPSYSLYPVLADIHGACEKCRAAQTGFQPAERRGIEARRQLEIRRGADVCDDAERAERTRLQNVGTGKVVPRAKRRRGSGRGLRGFRGGKRA